MSGWKLGDYIVIKVLIFGFVETLVEEGNMWRLLVTSGGGSRRFVDVVVLQDQNRPDRVHHNLPASAAARPACSSAVFEPKSSPIQQGTSTCRPC